MQRAIWFITFFIILAISYYWVIVDDTRTQKMLELADSDTELSGNVNSTVEIYDRLEKKWIGTSKHVQTLQNETHDHYRAYAEQMDSVDIVFEEIKFTIEQLEETLTRKIDRVKDNAIKFGDGDFYNELCRVMIHGVLHLVGFNDKTPDEKAVMRSNETKCLILR